MHGSVPPGAAAFDTVALRTVDELVKTYGLQYIDILKTDTEGAGIAGPQLHAAASSKFEAGRTPELPRPCP